MPGPSVQAIVDADAADMAFTVKAGQITGADAAAALCNVGIDRAAAQIIIKVP